MFKEGKRLKVLVMTLFLFGLVIFPLIPKVESSEILEPAIFTKSFPASIRGSPEFDNNPVTIPDKSELSFYNISVLFSPTSHSATGWANVSFQNTENVALDHVFIYGPWKLKKLYLVPWKFTQSLTATILLWSMKSLML